ncbi:unnamed protein product [Darwinula stevensoni]|uniref:MD-2-related lipid-recognition domain-containing protein n=1 Tax=Darwinula stevensoni TaxID=69355 RepID=A0A7R9FP85_9CRUS|nr:unnamed protein product [Darwinula stevensoni]CAG0897677.1 unnamed protein product [Darwinula stevensoni]
MKFLIVLFALFASAFATTVQDCQGGQTPIGRLIRVDIEGCQTPPCILPQGSIVNFEIEFETGEAGEDLEPEIVAILAGIEIPYDGVPKEACEDLIQGDCPYAKNEVLIYSQEFEILPIFPPVEVTVRWALKDEMNRWHMCFEVDIEVTLP